jgi:hypothetical protein
VPQFNIATRARPALGKRDAWLPRSRVGTGACGVGVGIYALTDPTFQPQGRDLDELALAISVADATCDCHRT